MVAVNSAKLLLFSSLGAVRGYLTSVNGCPDFDRLDLTYCMRYGGVIVSSFSLSPAKPSLREGDIYSVSHPLFPTFIRSHGN